MTREIKERICKDCGKVFFYNYNIGYCSECRSRRHSESRKRAFAKELEARREEYSFKRWEDCFFDDDTISESFKCVSFLLKHFGNATDSLSEIKDRLESRMASITFENCTEEDLEILRNSDVWKLKIASFIANTLWNHVESLLGFQPDFGSPIMLAIDNFVPSPKVGAYLIAHFKNHQKCRDPYRLVPLMLANLELSIIKEFNQKHKDIIDESIK